MFDLTDEQRAIQRLTRDFAEGEIKPIAEEIDREHRFPYEVIAKAAEIGLMRGIKEQFDPTGILNPMKIFPTVASPAV